MKINKDLADAVMMLSVIILVLVGTSTFESVVTKNILMAVLATLAIFMGIARYFGSKGNISKD